MAPFTASIVTLRSSILHSFRLEKAMICIATSCPEKSAGVIDDFLQSITDPTQKA